MVAADLDTGFIARHEAALIPPPVETPAAALAAFAAVYLERLRLRDEGAGPWDRRRGFRLFGASEEVLALRDAVRVRQLLVRRRRGAMEVVVDDGAPISVQADLSADLRAAVDGAWHRVPFTLDDGVVSLTFDGVDHTLELLDPYAPRGGDAAAEGRLSAPIPGRVVQMLVAAGTASCAARLSRSWKR